MHVLGQCWGRAGKEVLDGAALQGVHGKNEGWVGGVRVARAGVKHFRVCMQCSSSYFSVGWAPALQVPVAVAIATQGISKYTDLCRKPTWSNVRCSLCCTIHCAVQFYIQHLDADQRRYPVSAGKFGRSGACGHRNTAKSNSTYSLLSCRPLAILTPA